MMLLCLSVPRDFFPITLHHSLIGRQPRDHLVTSSHFVHPIVDEPIDSSLLLGAFDEFSHIFSLGTHKTLQKRDLLWT
jgi:hypothetical protein